MGDCGRRTHEKHLEDYYNYHLDCAGSCRQRHRRTHPGNLCLIRRILPILAEFQIQDVYEPREGEPVVEKAEGYQYLGRLTLTFDEEADKDLENCRDSEKGNKNVRTSDVMPMQGEEQDYRSEEYYERTDITFMIHVEEPYFVNYSTSLMSVDLKELKKIKKTVDMKNYFC